MSGFLDIVRSRPVPQGPIEKKLAVEDDRRLVRSIGAGQVAGAWFVAWVLTVKIAIPNLPYEPLPEEIEDRLPPRITFIEPAKKAPVTKALPRENRGRTRATPNPSEQGGQLKVATLDSRKDKPGLPGYAIIKDALKAVDLIKIDRVERLTRTEPTVLAGRRGVKSEAYNDPYAGGDGTTDEIDLMPANGPGRIAPSRGVDDLIAGTRSEITVSSEGRFRSSEEILSVVRSHTPGLRHLYNTHLKANPGLGGKVTVRFAVSPGGLVVDAAIASGTTGAPRFEEQVLARIRAWRFSPIKAAGNDIVTVPFNFSE